MKYRRTINISVIQQFQLQYLVVCKMIKFVNLFISMKYHWFRSIHGPRESNTGSM